MNSKSESASSQPQEPTLRYAAFTHRGKPFRHNQDAILVDGRVIQQAEFVDGALPLGERHRFAVSDGVSGQPQPAAASRLLLQGLLALDASHPTLSPQWRAEKLRDRLTEALDREPRLEDAAATLITVEVAAHDIRLWHAGDSRGYRIAHGQAMLLTRDHTTLNTLIAEGQLTAREFASFRDTWFANALDNIFVYSHHAEPPTVSVQTITLEPDEILLLVSDGITNELADLDIAACVTADDLPASAHRLFDAVMAKGASDDLSAILMALERSGP